KGRGTGGSKMCKCGKVLLHAHPEMLKKKFGLTDEQISRIRKNKVNFFEKKISLRSQIDLLGFQLGLLFEEDLPDQGKVLNLMRKKRSLKGQLKEEKVKSILNAMAVLTKEQRDQVRARCWDHGKGHGPGYPGFGPGGSGPGGFGPGHGGMGPGKGCRCGKGFGPPPQARPEDL
ncbi:MAG: hypothetical protein V1754_14950, partial [Pseudomonadota bacterium]